MASFDPCADLSPADLQNLGVNGSGKPVGKGINETGCEYNAGDFNFRIYKGEDSDRSYWDQRKSNFEVFEPNKVGTHEGIKGIAAGGAGTGQCRQVVLAGGGSVSFVVTFRAGSVPSDEATCAKALEIAEAVEPKLPK